MRRSDEGCRRGRRPELSEVVGSVGVIDVVCAPSGLGVAVGDPVINDPVATTIAFEPGAVVLGVGVDGSSARQLVRRAGESGAAAVIVKGDVPVELRSEAERGGVALLAVPVEMTWSQLHMLVLTALSGTSDQEEEAGGVPLGDLFALANAVAAMVGGPTTIEDRHSRVLAYSTLSERIDEPRRETILGRRVPEEWLRRLEEAGVFDRLWRGELVRYEAGPDFDLKPRLALAVRAGDTILGSVWVAEGDTPLPDHAEEALREAARIAALHLIRYRASGDLDRASRGELLREVLEDRTPVDHAAFRLGVRSDDGFAVLAFRPHAADEVEDALQRERALDLVALYGEAFRQRSAVVELAGTIYVLLPGPAPERLVALASDVVGRARQSLGARLRAGVGPVVDHLRDASRSRREADLVLRVLADDPAGPDVADVDAVHERIALSELHDFADGRPFLRSRPVAALAAHDADHATQYVTTLRAYLESFGDIGAAARSLNVHPNSFRYRLRRLVELSGIDLTDRRERLLAEIDLFLGLAP